MSETEVMRDPLEVAADEAADVMGEREKMNWTDFIEMLTQRAEKAARRLSIAQRLQAAFAADGGQLPLIPGAVAEPKKPRAKRRVMMHVPDEGGVFACPKCNTRLLIADGTSDVALRRGIPCPTCNEATEE